jgi:hypothetical protein
VPPPPPRWEVHFYEDVFGFDDEDFSEDHSHDDGSKRRRL